MNTRPPISDPHAVADEGAAADVASASAEFRLLVWIHPQRGWRARVVGADDVGHDFASPFELARFVAWPIASGGGGWPGLR